MNFSVRSQLVNFHLLLQITIFLGELYQCTSITYHLSHDECKGSDLDRKCNGAGEQLARITDSASLDKAKQAITNHGIKYWTGLRYHKNKGYCWKEDDDCGAGEPSSILDTHDKGSWTQGWYCFLVDKNKAKLEVKRCPEANHPYICEKGDLSSQLSSMPTKQASVQPATIATKTETEPTSTTTSEVSTSNLPKLTTKMISTEIFLTPSTTTKTAATAAVATAVTVPVLTRSVISRSQTTEVFIVKETLTTAGAVSSLTAASTVNTSTQDKLSAADKLRQYVSAISALNVSEESSLQGKLREKHRLVWKDGSNGCSKVNYTNPGFNQGSLLIKTNGKNKKNATKTTVKLLRSLKKDNIDREDINVLLATQTLEKFAISYGKIHNKANESKVISEELLAIKIQKISADNKEAIVFSVNETRYTTKEGSANITLPPEIFKGQEAVVVSVIYNDVKDWIPDAMDVELHGIKFTNLKAGSPIIASTVDPEPSDTLEENVTIAFSYDKEVKKGDTPLCVFWDFTLESKLNGSWASTGCSLVQRVNKEIICSCNHLTNFAVLMQVGHRKVPSYHTVALEIITYVGCALSLAGELLTILAYCALMNLKQEQVQIRFNLVVAIAIAQIVFLSGIDASETRGVCVFVAALIHYFYLAGFAWMLFEGLYLYLMVVKVFNTVIRMRLFYAFAWGFPLVMVMLSLVIASSQDGGVNSYVPGDFCWVSFTNNLIWTFAAPVLTVCLINSTILARVLFEIVKMQSDKTSELDKIRQGLKACAVLFPLLGMTWVFGILSVTDAGLVFQYIFTILNSLQGLFIFLIHVLRNSDVRAAFLRKKQKWKESRSISTSRVTSQGVDKSSNTLTNEDSQELTSRRNDRSRSSAAGYTNMSIVEQDRSMTPVQM